MTTTPDKVFDPTIGAHVNQVALHCEVLRLDPGPGGPPCDQVAMYELEWATEPELVITLCPFHANQALNRFGPADEWTRIREPLDFIRRAVSVRAAYAFGDWPPAVAR